MVTRLIGGSEVERTSADEDPAYSTRRDDLGSVHSWDTHGKVMMASLNQKERALHTPDGRYIVVDGTLWRATNPALPQVERDSLVRELMAARRAVKAASNFNEIRLARQRVHDAKVRLGERGPVWWKDGQRDWSRKKALNSPYADWFRQSVAACPNEAVPDGPRT